MLLRCATSLMLSLTLACSSENSSDHRSSATAIGGNGGASGGNGGAGNGGAGNGGSGGTTTADAGDPGAISMTEITVNDMTFDARVAGPEDGEVVFLLHGFPETSYEWRNVMPPLARAGYRVIAPDQRGYSPGARPPNVEDYTVALLVVDVIGMADEVGADTFHVVGHDWGAAVAWGVATVFPERVLTANPMSVPHPDAFASLLADPTSEQYAASAYFDLFSQPDYEDTMLANDAAFMRNGMFPGLEPAVVDEYLRVIGTKESLGAALNWYRANVADRQLQTGGPIGLTATPTMFIWSDGDTALVREGVDLTADYVSGPYRLEIIEGVDHWLVDREPDQVSELLLDHLGG